MAMHPEFICVGTQKAGTSWLYDQAKSHPRIWMPPIKEIRYFCRGDQLARRARKQLQVREERSGAELADARGEFLRSAASVTGNNIDEYVRLFDVAGDNVTGDITPDYFDLPDDLIVLLSARLPDCRFLCLVRDPVSRLWSQVTMRVRREKISRADLANLEAFKKVVESSALRRCSFQSQDIRRWRGVLGPERFRVFMMEDLVADPAAYRRAVFAHIGLDGDECAIVPTFNRKDEQEKLQMPKEYRAYLQDYFADEYRNFRRETEGCRLHAPAMV